MMELYTEEVLRRSRQRALESASQLHRELWVARRAAAKTPGGLSRGAPLRAARALVSAGLALLPPLRMGL